ncbi:MAG: hypothetical protein ISS82_06205 [Nanoarchaeota archaeon]|nr:hypothetical protein [Nanoarchaeota archaeon]
MKLNIIIIIILLCILMIPGLLFTEILAHELYHAIYYKEYAKEICVDINHPLRSHTVLRFENGSLLLDYDGEAEKLEIEQAERIGKLASIVYLIVFSVVLFWFIYLMKKK